MSLWSHLTKTQGLKEKLWEAETSHRSCWHSGTFAKGQDANLPEMVNSFIPGLGSTKTKTYISRQPNCFVLNSYLYIYMVLVLTISSLIGIQNEYKSNLLSRDVWKGLNTQYFSRWRVPGCCMRRRKASRCLFLSAGSRSSIEVIAWGSFGMKLENIYSKLWKMPLSHPSILIGS